jgi:hypothetical protein
MRLAKEPEEFVKLLQVFFAELKFLLRCLYYNLQFFIYLFKIKWVTWTQININIEAITIKYTYNQIKVKI